MTTPNLPTDEEDDQPDESVKCETDDTEPCQPESRVCEESPEEEREVEECSRPGELDQRHTTQTDSSWGAPERFRP